MAAALEGARRARARVVNVRPGAPLRRVVFAAAEASGDLLGAEVLRGLHRHGRFLAVGVGGEAMRAAGLLAVPGSVPLRPATGLTEVLASVPTLVRNTLALRRALLGADLLVVIDAPDQHLPLARKARALGVPVVGVVAPQTWAWRPGRVSTVAASLDQLLCLLPFEPAIYADTGLDAVFVGHPAAERVPASSREPGVVAIFPGSRRAELHRHLAVFVAVAQASGAREILLPRASTIPAELLQGLPATVTVCLPEVARARAERAVTKAGTSTLELALAGIPAVVAHRVAPLTGWIARRFVRGVRHVALPSIVLGEQVYPEVLQELDMGVIADALRSASPPDSARIRATLRAHPEGFGAACAEAILRRWPTMTLSG